MASFELSVRSSSIPLTNGTYNILFTTGPLGAVFVNRIVGFSGTAGLAQVFKTPTGVTGGTDQIAHRLNQRNTTVATGVMKAGVTVATTGTAASAISYYRGSSGNGQSVIGTYASQQLGRTLEPNSVYLLQFINNDAAAQVVDFYFQWYEGKQ